MADATARWPVDLLRYCLMPNHFHLVIRTHADGDLGRWVRWLLVAHAQRHDQGGSEAPMEKGSTNRTPSTSRPS